MLIHIERHWEEEIAVSMIMFYQILLIDKWRIAHCSNALVTWLLKFPAQKMLLFPKLASSQAFRTRKALAE